VKNIKLGSTLDSTCVHLYKEKSKVFGIHKFEICEQKVTFVAFKEPCANQIY